MAYSIYSSIKDAYTSSTNNELKADIFLSVYGKNYDSKEYRDIQKRIPKLTKKIQKFDEKNKSKESTSRKCKSFEIEMEDLLKQKSELIKTYKLKPRIDDYFLIAKRLIFLYRKGLMVQDTIRGVNNINSSYGRMVSHVFKEMEGGIIKLVKRAMNKIEPSYLNLIINDDPRLKNKNFLDTKEGALLLESHFIIYLVNLSVKDYDEEELNKLLNEIAKEIAEDDEELLKEVNNARNLGAATQGFSKALLQIVRLSVGKGIFMNTAVKITNVVLRAIAGKGMTYARNAVFRKFLARFLGSGPLALLITVLLFVPDVAALINKRDYNTTIRVIFLLYFLRISLENKQ